MGDFSIEAVEESPIGLQTTDEENTTTRWEGRDIFLGSNHQPKDRGNIDIIAFLGSNYTTNSPERQEKERRQREDRERQEGKPDAVENGA